MNTSYKKYRNYTDNYWVRFRDSLWEELNPIQCELVYDLRCYKYERSIAMSTMVRAGHNEDLYNHAFRIAKECDDNMKRIVRILRRFDNGKY